MTGEWPIRESRTEYETGWYDGGYDLVEQPDGTTKRYYWARLPPAVVVVALDGDDVLVVRQYRPTTRRSFVELPAGIVEDSDGEVSDDGGASPAAYESAAHRELEEETGYVAESVTCIQRTWVATGVLRHERGIVVAPDAAPEGDRALDTNEFIEVDRLPVDDAIEQVRAAPANDATLEALLLAERAGYL